MFNRIISAAILAGLFAAGSVSATGLNGWVAGVNGNSSSVTTGGSKSETAANGNGYAANATLNAGAGLSYASGSFSPSGVVTSSGAGSVSTGFSGSTTFGSASGNTAGAVGTDVNSGAWGSFKASGFGGFLNW